MEKVAAKKPFEKQVDVEQQGNQVKFEIPNAILSKSCEKAKEKILQEILVAIHALLNTNGGGTLMLVFNDRESKTADKFIQMIEQKLLSSTATQTVTSNIEFEPFQDGVIYCQVKKCDEFVTTNHNLYVPSETQANPIPPTEEIKDTILMRRDIPQPIPSNSHHSSFIIDVNCGFTENKNTEFKCLKSTSSKRTTLADRMTGKGNKFSCYVSAFGNHNGGHIYYGIEDDSVVKGQFIPNKKDKEEIIKKVEKVINKMIWPAQIVQPKRGKQWEIFFEPVIDKTSKPVPSTFVIVIYIAPCLGGVFTEEPECYEIMDKKVKKMSFTAWRNRISQPKEMIPYSVARITFSSPATQKAFNAVNEQLRELINDGKWYAISRLCASLQKKFDSCETNLVILSKQATACYRRGHFNHARSFLEQYETILPQVDDVLIFEVVGLHITAGLKRATGDLDGLKGALAEALLKAELIEPGLVTATVFAFAATVSDLIWYKEPTNNLSKAFSIRALEHSQYVKDCSRFHADMAQKAHITLTTFYLGLNLGGGSFKDDIAISDLHKAKCSLMTVFEPIYEGNPLSWYREIQFKLAQSIYYYRLSQVKREGRVHFLRSAFKHAKWAECLARDHQFREMVAWSQANTALLTEELVREKLIELNLPFTIHPNVYARRHTLEYLTRSDFLSWL